MSKNNFKISCWVFVAVFQIGCQINFAKGNYESEIEISRPPINWKKYYDIKLGKNYQLNENEKPKNYHSIANDDPKNYFSNANDKVLKPFSPCTCNSEEDYSKMTEILVYNLNIIHTEMTESLKKIVKEIEILKQNSDNDREKCVKNQNEVETKLDEVLSEIEEALEAAKTCSLEKSVFGGKENPTDLLGNNTGIDYFFGVGKLVKFDIQKVCINPVTKLSTRPKNTPPTLFHTGKFFNYYDALKECENRNGVVFIPKTLEENDLWLAFVKNLHSTARISEAFYPKTFYHEIKRFLWADCAEHSDFFKIKLRDNQFCELVQRWFTEFSNSVGAICVKYWQGNFVYDHCEKSREGLAICERVLNV